MLPRDPAEGHRGADRGTGARVRLPHHGHGHVPRHVQARDRGAVLAQYAGVGIGQQPALGAATRSEPRRCRTCNSSAGRRGSPRSRPSWTRTRWSTSSRWERRSVSRPASSSGAGSTRRPTWPARRSWPTRRAHPLPSTLRSPGSCAPNWPTSAPAASPSAASPPTASAAWRPRSSARATAHHWRPSRSAVRPTPWSSLAWPRPFAARRLPCAGGADTGRGRGTAVTAEHIISSRASGEPPAEAGSPMASGMTPQRRSGLVLISQYQA